MSEAAQLFLENPKNTILTRYARIMREWQESHEIVRQQQARQQALTAEYQDCLAAGRVFGLDVIRAYPEWAAQASAQEELWAGYRAHVVDRVRSLAVLPPRRPVRELILEAAEKAHPNPVRANELRSMLEEQGVTVHEKTVGMTLYRLKLKGEMRRRKGTSDWYFVPKEEMRRSTAPEDDLEAETADYGDSEVDDRL